jgi:hypothetical protein
MWQRWWLWLYFLGDTHEECQCFCYPKFAIVNGRKIPFKRFSPKIKITSQTKLNICINNLTLAGLAEILNKYLPNRIFIPANKLDKKVKGKVTNSTLGKIITDLGLRLL